MTAADPPHQDSTDPKTIVLRTLAAWAAGDVDGAIALVAEEAVYTTNLDAEPPFTGSVGGKADLARRLRAVLAMFDLLARVVISISAEGPIVRTNSLYYYRHRESGHVLDGHNRMVFRIENGLIVSLESYLDAPMFETFLRLSRSDSH